MNIINNSISIDSFKNSAIQSNTNILNVSSNTSVSDVLQVSNIEKTIFDDFNNTLNIKSDTYLASKTQLDNTTNLIALAKKLLYNENFREIAINSNPKLKEIYDNFIEAIAADDSKLAEYIKSVLSDSNKFSGEFFQALNKLMSDTNDISLKNSIYDFLKIFDYYFSQNENASAVNSALNELLSKLPEDLRNYLLKLLSNSFDNNLNLALLAILDAKLPDREKLKLVISYLLDFADKYNNVNDSNPLDIFNNFTQLIAKSNDENIKFINNALKTIKESNLDFDNELKSLVENLEVKISSQNANISDNFISEQSLNMQRSNIKLLNELIQSANATTGSAVELNANDIIKLIDSLNASASFDDKNLINNLKIDLEKINLQNLSELSSIFDRIKNNILNSNSYPKNIKDNLLNLFNKFTDNILENLVFSNHSKNKCEVLLNIYEKNIMPNLLKSSEQFNLSYLKHNLLRLKLGTADEFNNQIKSFFNQLNYMKLKNTEESVGIKLSLINKLVEQQEINSGMKEFLKLLDTGMKFSSNEQNRTTFESTLLSLISKDDLMVKYKHFFLPLLYNGQNVLSEIFLGIDKIKDENKKRESSGIDDLVFKITMILDVENKGVFNTTIVFSNGEVSANVAIPKDLSSSSIKIYNDLKYIITKNKLKANSVIIS